MSEEILSAILEETESSAGGRRSMARSFDCAQGHCAVVVTGIGARGSCDVAAELSIAAIQDVLCGESAGPLSEHLRNAFAMAHELIRDESTHSGSPEMGALAVVACVTPVSPGQGQEITFAWVGPMRAFLVRSGDLLFRAATAPVVGDHLELGQHDERGSGIDDLQISDAMILSEGDLALITSEGLALQGFEIGPLIAGMPPKESAETLMNASAERGGAGLAIAILGLPGAAGVDRAPVTSTSRTSTPPAQAPPQAASVPSNWLRRIQVLALGVLLLCAIGLLLVILWPRKHEKAPVIEAVEIVEPGPPVITAPIPPPRGGRR